MQFGNRQESNGKSILKELKYVVVVALQIILKKNNVIFFWKRYDSHVFWRFRKIIQRLFSEPRNIAFCEFESIFSLPSFKGTFYVFVILYYGKIAMSIFLLALYIKNILSGNHAKL